MSVVYSDSNLSAANNEASSIDQLELQSSDGHLHQSSAPVTLRNAREHWQLVADPNASSAAPFAAVASRSTSQIAIAEYGLQDSLNARPMHWSFPQPILRDQHSFAEADLRWQDIQPGVPPDGQTTRRAIHSSIPDYAIMDRQISSPPYFSPAAGPLHEHQVLPFGITSGLDRVPQAYAEPIHAPSLPSMAQVPVWGDERRLNLMRHVSHPGLQPLTLALPPPHVSGSPFRNPFLPMNISLPDSPGSFFSPALSELPLASPGSLEPSPATSPSVMHGPLFSPLPFASYSNAHPPGPVWSSPASSAMHSANIVDSATDYFQVQTAAGRAGRMQQSISGTRRTARQVDDTPVISAGRPHRRAKMYRTPSSPGSAISSDLPNARPAKRETHRLDGVCEICSQRFAAVNLRGASTDFDTEYTLSYTCYQCGQSQHTTAVDTNVMAYNDVRASGKGIGAAFNNRKRPKVADQSTPAHCDVCNRIVAFGGPRPLTRNDDLQFVTELVCSRCELLYARCSDCGGGGGLRLGVGKWRCRQLFAPGRRTCTLNHARHSSVASMQYNVCAIRNIPPGEFTELETQCKGIFRSSLLASLAVPEIIEKGVAMVHSYEDVLDKVDNGWSEARINMEDIEESEGIRRYIGLRWSAPKPRKSSAAVKQEFPTADEDNEVVPGSGSLLRPGKLLSGYITAEWDIHGGTFFVSVCIPYTAGEQYEGSSHLVTLLQNRAVRDREEFVGDLLARGDTTAAKQIPPILHSFTMIFYSRDSKLLAFFENKRQLIPLERYLSKYPDTDRAVFPPIRKCYLQDSRQDGWICLVRRLNPATTAISAFASQEQVDRLAVVPIVNERATIRSCAAWTDQP